jgi:hypothetical protein
MQQVQLTFKQLAEAAIELGATPNAIRVWRQRGIPYRYQVKLMQHFNGALILMVSSWEAKSNSAKSWKGAASRQLGRAKTGREDTKEFSLSKLSLYRKLATGNRKADASGRIFCIDCHVCTRARDG